MSAQSWRKKYYLHEADSETALAVPAAHSLLKWRGFEDLEAHGLKPLLGATLEDADGNELETGCALCKKAKLDAENEADGYCEKCVLYKVRDNVPCDEERPDEDYSPWSLWCATYNPKPMIHWLEIAAKREAEEN